MSSKTLLIGIILSITGNSQTIDYINQVKNGNYIDVKTYGAKCDGSTDDSLAFSRAISQVLTSGQTLVNSGICSVPLGISFTIPAGFGFKYDGMSGSSIKCGTADCFVIDTLGSAYEYIHNLTLVGPDTQDGNSYCSSFTSGNGFYLKNSGPVAPKANIQSIKASNFCGSGKYAIRLNNIENSYAFGLNGKISDGGIFFSNITATTLNVEAENNTTHGVYIQSINAIFTNLVSQSNKLENLWIDGLVASRIDSMYLENPNVSLTANTCNAIFTSSSSSKPLISNFISSSTLHNLTNSNSSSNVGICMSVSGSGLNRNNHFDGVSASGVSAVSSMDASSSTQWFSNFGDLTSITGITSSTRVDPPNSFYSMLPSGSAATPSYSFSVFPSVGMYASGGNLGFATAGIVGMFLDTNQKLNTLLGIINAGTITSTGDISTAGNFTVSGANINLGTKWLNYVPSSDWVIRDVTNSINKLTVIHGTSGVGGAVLDGTLNVLTGYQINGTGGVTGNTCTHWTSGLCTTP